MLASKYGRKTKETVSYDTLKDKLPPELYEAVIKSEDCSVNAIYDDTLQREYFNAEPDNPLTEAEQNYLREQLGNDFVKNPLSTKELRSYLDTRQRENDVHDNDDMQQCDDENDCSFFTNSYYSNEETKNPTLLTKGKRNR